MSLAEYKYKGFKQRHKKWQSIILTENDLSGDWTTFIKDNREAYYKRKKAYDKRQQEIIDTFMDHILEHLL